MQINRLFEIVYVLLDKKSVTSKELAERFEVSSRTIYRDIETLSSAGIPVYMSKGKGGGISLLPDFVLNKTVITDEEKEDILSSLKAVNAINLCKTDTALNKLSSLFGESNTDWIEVDFFSWANAQNETETFNTIKSAIYSKRVISFSELKHDIFHRQAIFNIMPIQSIHSETMSHYTKFKPSPRTTL